MITIPPGGYDQDRLYLDLKGTRERPCRAQTFVSAEDRVLLQAAVTRVDLVDLERVIRT